VGLAFIIRLRVTLLSTHSQAFG